LFFAWVVLWFVVLFKFTDALSGTMTGPFVIKIGFTREEYAAIVKGLGLAATLIGGFAGGFVARAFPLATSLSIGGSLPAGARPRVSLGGAGGGGLPPPSLPSPRGKFTTPRRRPPFFSPP